jgi:hypothetical protein
MSAGRIALVAAGLLFAAGALFLIVRGFRGEDAGPAAAATSPEAPEKTAAGGRAEEKPPPRWQSFIRPDERATPPRPVVRLVQDLPSPFDRLPDGGGAAASGGGGGARPASPGFRLEGISFGAQTVALISGHAVRQGDAISGFRVVRIGRSAVTLAGPRGARLDLALGGGGR